MTREIRAAMGWKSKGESGTKCRVRACREHTKLCRMFPASGAIICTTCLRVAISDAASPPFRDGHPAYFFEAGAKYHGVAVGSDLKKFSRD
jgi:hypothetical protein